MSSPPPDPRRRPGGDPGIPAETSASASWASSAPTEAEVLAAILELAREHLDLEDESVLDEDPRRLAARRLVEDLGLDSVQLLTLAVEVENHFRVTLDEFDPGFAVEEGGQVSGEGGAVEPVGTVGDLVRLVRLRLAEEGGAGPATGEAG